MSIIYIVKGSQGEYSDWNTWNEKAFTDKAKAEEYAIKLDEENTLKARAWKANSLGEFASTDTEFEVTELELE